MAAAETEDMSTNEPDEEKQTWQTWQIVGLVFVCIFIGILLVGVGIWFYNHSSFAKQPGLINDNTHSSSMEEPEFTISGTHSSFVEQPELTNDTHSSFVEEPEFTISGTHSSFVEQPKLTNDTHSSFVEEPWLAKDIGGIIVPIGSFFDLYRTFTTKMSNEEKQKLQSSLVNKYFAIGNELGAANGKTPSRHKNVIQEFLTYISYINGMFKHIINNWGENKKIFDAVATMISGLQNIDQKNTDQEINDILSKIRAELKKLKVT